MRQRQASTELATQPQSAPQRAEHRGKADDEHKHCNVILNILNTASERASMGRTSG